MNNKRKFEYVFTDDNINKNLYCSICQDVFFKPVRIQCGHTFCKPCIQSWYKKSLTCPLCRKKIKKSRLEKDLLGRQLVGDLNIQCIHSDCDWQGTLECLGDHLKACEKEKQIQNEKTQKQKSLTLKQKKIQKFQSKNCEKLHSFTHLQDDDSIMYLHQQFQHFSEDEHENEDQDSQQNQHNQPQPQQNQQQQQQQQQQLIYTQQQYNNMIQFFLYQTQLLQQQQRQQQQQQQQQRQQIQQQYMVRPFQQQQQNVQYYSPQGSPNLQPVYIIPTSINGQVQPNQFQLQQQQQYMLRQPFRLGYSVAGAGIMQEQQLMQQQQIRQQ